MKKFSHLCLLMLLLTLAAGYSVRANSVDPKEYRKKIASARSMVKELSENTEKEIDLKNLAGIRETIPEKISVKSSDQELEASHIWLHSLLEKLENSKDPFEQKAILSDIDERLSAIDFKAAEAENLLEDEKLAGKDANKQKIASILQREEYRTPGVVEDSFITRLWKSFLEWLDSLLSIRRPAGSMGGTSWLTRVLQAILVIIIVMVAGFVIYKLAPLVLPRLRKRNKDKVGERVVLGETIDSDQSSEDIFAEAEALARSGDVRNAIRKAYIALLCGLSDRKLIGLAAYKTNRDYLSDLRQNKVLFENVRLTTGLYEMNWYGYHPADQEDWDRFRSAYREVFTI